MFDAELTMTLEVRNVDTLILLGFATSDVVLSITRYATVVIKVLAAEGVVNR